MLLFALCPAISPVFPNCLLCSVGQLSVLFYGEEPRLAEERFVPAYRSSSASRHFLATVCSPWRSSLLLHSAAFLPSCVARLLCFSRSRRSFQRHVSCVRCGGECVWVVPRCAHGVIKPASHALNAVPCSPSTSSLRQVSNSTGGPLACGQRRR